nr:hypothetical protein [Micromonospora provocatoris]
MGDDDVLGSGPYRAGEADVPGDGGTQARVPGRVGVALPDRRGTQFPGDQPPPGCQREQPGVRGAGPEVVSRAGRGGGGGFGGRPERAGAYPTGRCRTGRARATGSSATNVPAPTRAVSRPSAVSRS